MSVSPHVLIPSKLNWYVSQLNWCVPVCPSKIFSSSVPFISFLFNEAIFCLLFIFKLNAYKREGYSMNPKYHDEKLVESILIPHL